MRCYRSLFPPLAAVPYVVAHGYVYKVKIDDKAYAGNVPNNGNGASPIRLISDVDPVKGANNSDLNCGHGAAKAALVASADPGSILEFSRHGGDGSHWPHEVGPLMTYMAECINTTCDNFDSTNARWFKIDQAAKKHNDTQTWYQHDYFADTSFAVSLPNNIKAGDYLVHHEIVALHVANTVGGAEFYPSCTQIRVGGTGGGVPDEKSLVAFPGGYTDTDPGIFDPNVYDPDAKYQFPGPAVVDLSSSSSNSSASDIASTPSESVSSDMPTVSDAPSTSLTSSATQTGAPSPSENCRSNKKRTFQNGEATTTSNSFPTVRRNKRSSGGEEVASAKPVSNYIACRNAFRVNGSRCGGLQVCTESALRDAFVTTINKPAFA